MNVLARILHPTDMPMLGTFRRLSRSVQDLTSQIHEDWTTNHRDWTMPGFRAIAVHRFGRWVSNKRPGALRTLLLWLYQAMYRYGSHQSATRAWLKPTLMTETLFHKDLFGQTITKGFLPDVHCPVGAPREAFIKITKHETGGVDQKGLWRPAALDDLERRARKVFALVGSTGYLSAALDVTPWNGNDALQAAAICFKPMRRRKNTRALQPHI